MSFNSALTAQRDHIRGALGDTSNDAAKEILADAFIDAKLAAFPFAEALAQCGEAVLARYAAEPDKFRDEGGGLDVEWRSRLKAVEAVIKRARAGLIADPLGTTPATSAVGLLTAPDLTGLR